MTTAADFAELDEITHTLERPDVFMGELNNVEKELYTYNPETDEVKFERVNYNTGLLKIFDEILTNAADNLQRQESGISTISVSIDDEKITISNDGRTIPIEKNEKDVWIPEMVFTHFRAGSNFKRKNKTTGGKNGIGAKLTSVFSKRFEIDIQCGNVSYHQDVEDNCKNVHPAIVKGKNKKKNIPPDEQLITITFYPDFEHLKIEEGVITEDNKKVLFKRCHDLSHLPIELFINDHEVPKLTWEEYVRKFGISNQMFTYATDRWKIAFGVSNDKFRQISYVNNVATYDGGEHVKYILDQIWKYTVEQDAEIKNVARSTFKQKIVIIVYSIIDDPSFKSQSKEELSTKPKDFGTTCQISLATLNLFITETDIIELLKPKQAKPNPNKTKKGKITNVEKLVEANLAGTKEGYKCTLFLCEGLSAKGMCDAGIGILGHNYFGCYPLRGKVLNTRNVSKDKYLANREISDVKTIIGLVDDYEYKPEDIKRLRYGRVVCVKDADSDGADIMGLIINFFDTKFPSLIRIQGFFCEFISPMIKVVYNPNDLKKRKVVPFYNEVEYKRFMDELTPQKKAFQKFSVEFIKGLATNEAEDVKEYFNHYEDNCIEITFTEKAENWLDMAFNNKKADMRKQWLTTITPDTHLPRTKGQPIDVIDFIRNDLVLFGYDACVRSIPSVIDGLKPSQRKILYTLFKMGKKGFNKMKVFQLGGLVANRANYHHGESSMNGTIIGMAQTFTGSGNNIPLLKPSGNFGSRTEFGEDAGAPRYISCSLDKLTRMIFPDVDDDLMKLKEEDNQLVEPFYYAPIVPTILINGAKGIGTGWSTEIPSFDPIDIIEYVEEMLKPKAIAKGKSKKVKAKPKIKSYYQNFTGNIKEFNDRWEYYGRVRALNKQTYIVEELPIRYTTSKFIDRLNYLSALGEMENNGGVSKSKSAQNKLDDLMKQAKALKIQWNPSPPIESFENHCAVEKINFKITFTKPVSEKEVMAGLGLTTTIKNTNMVAFDSEIQIKRYNTLDEIIREWFDVRYHIYELRQAKIINELEQQLKMISNKCRFIAENVDHTIDVKNVAKKVIIGILEEKKYDKIVSVKKVVKHEDDGEDGEDEDNDDEQQAEHVDAANGYDYLLGMKIYALTKEKFDELKRKQGEIEKKLNDYKALTVEDIWLHELEDLKNELTPKE